MPCVRVQLDLSDPLHWTTSSGMKAPPPDAYSTRMQMPAGAKIPTKGYPASMSQAAANPVAVRPRGAPITAPPVTAGSVRPPPSGGLSAFAPGRTAPPTAASRHSAFEPDSLSTLMNSMPIATPVPRSSPQVGVDASAEAQGSPPIQKQVLRAGHGSTARAGDTVIVAYVGWLTGNEAAIFDRSEQFSFTLGVSALSNDHAPVKRPCPCQTAAHPRSR